MASVPSLGGLATINPLQNPVLMGIQQGLQAAYLPQQMQAEIAKNRAIAEMNLGRGDYYGNRGDLAQSQAQVLVPAQANRFNAMANTLYPAIAQRQQATAQQLLPAEAAQKRAMADYYSKGGARGATIDYLSKSGEVPQGVAQQAAIATALQGSTPEVKRNFAYNAAQGNDVLQKSIQGANLKATSNQQLLRQQAGMEQFDAAVQPMLQDVGNAIAHYSGPGGALRLREDQIKQTSGGKPSAEYSAYLTAMQTQIPLIADNARKVLGAQASDAMQEQLQGIVGPGGKPDMKTLALMPPDVVYDKLNKFSTYLTKEAQVGRNFVGPLSMNPNEQQGVQEAPQVQAPVKNVPTPGADPKFDAWYAKKYGGK